MDERVFPIESFHDYEVMLLDHIKTWISTYLAARERFVGITPGAIARPRSWFTRQDFAALPGYESTPAVIIVSTGTAETPERHGDGRIDAQMRFAVMVLTHGPEAGGARELAGHYQAAMLMLLIRQRSFGSASLHEWLGMNLDDIDEDEERTLAAVRLECVYKIKDFVDASGGPLTVPVDPLAPIPPYGTVVETNIDIERGE
jgi:hypothetical protein